jgi:hypothetical protein
VTTARIVHPPNSLKLWHVVVPVDAERAACGRRLRPGWCGYTTIRADLFDAERFCPRCRRKLRELAVARRRKLALRRREGA